MPKVICRLSDTTCSVLGSQSSTLDFTWTTKELYYVVDLRPTKFATKVKCLVDRRVASRPLGDGGPERLRAARMGEVGNPLGGINGDCIHAADSAPGRQA